MNIGIDARLITYRRGMGNFIYNLLLEYAKIDSPHKFILYVDDADASTRILSNPKFVFMPLSPKLYPLWEQWALPRQVGQDKLDVLHCPANTAPIWLPQKTKLILTVHDVMYLLPKAQMPQSPSLYQQLGRIYRRCVVPQVARHADKIVTVSQYSANDICREINCKHSRVAVVYEAPGPAFKKMDDSTMLALIKQKHGLSDPFILTLGATDPRKNTARVIEAFSNFKTIMGKRYQLAIVGLKEADKSFFRQVARRFGVESDIALLGFIDEQDLAALYNTAQTVVYPSLYEGFGLPVLEAMACGAPVISSQTTAIPEIAGQAALLLDPTSTDALTQAMLRIESDDQLREQLIQRGYAQTQRFSWARAAHEMLDIYEGAQA